MSEPQLQTLADQIETLENRLNATIDAIAHLIRAVESIRADDGEEVFEVDLAKTSLHVAGYEEQ